MFPKGRITKNPQLQQDIERYMRLSDGASRILSISQNPLQCLNAAKMLFVSNTQLLSCLRQVQQEKVREASSIDSNHADSSPQTPDVKTEEDAHSGQAKICLSDIRIPLMWRDTPLGTGMQLLMNRLFPSTSILSTGILAGSGDTTDKTDSGDQCEGYSVFCLAQVGNVIKDTQLIFDIKPGTADVEFDDKLVFEDVTSDFRCTIEVYSYPRTSAKGSSAFARRRTLLLDNLRRPTDHPDSGPISGIVSQNSSNFFELVGRCVATLADVGNRARAHRLEFGSQLPCTCTHELISANSSPTKEDSHETTDTPPNLYSLEPGSGNANASDLPLLGSICYRMVAQPNSAVRPLFSGLLWIRQLTTSPAQAPALLHHCELGAGHLWTRLLLHTHTIDDQTPQHYWKADFKSRNASTDAFSVNTMPIGTKSSVRLRKRHPKRLSDSEGHLALPITPKTLFLDKEPVLRVLCVRFPALSKSDVSSEKPSDISSKVNCTKTKRTSNDFSCRSEETPGSTEVEKLHVDLASPSQSVSHKEDSSLIHWRSVTNVHQISDSSDSSAPAVSSRWRSSTAIFATVPTNCKVIDMLCPSIRTQQLHTNTIKNNSSCPDFSLDRGARHFTRHASNSPGRSWPPSTSDTIDWFNNRSPVRHTKLRSRGRFHLSRSLGSLASFPISSNAIPKRPSLPTAWYKQSQDSVHRWETKSVASVSLTSIPMDDLDKISGDDVSENRAVEVSLYTFRIATSSLHNVESHTKTHFSRSEVYEFAIPKHDLRTLTSKDTSVSPGQSPLDNPPAELQLATRWLNLLQQHVLEQKTWGADAFSNKTTIPQSSSTMHNAPARRSLAFSAEQPVSYAGKLFAPPLTTCVEIG